MYKKQTMKFFRFVAILLALALLLPTGIRSAKAEQLQPRASDYLDSYNGYIYPAGSGYIQVWFTVTGNYYLDSIGALTIKIYESTDNENWEWVKTYTHDTTLSMMDYNDFYHSGHVDYQGVAGRYYNAYISIWGGKDGGGDTRYFFTGPVQAT